MEVNVNVGVRRERYRERETKKKEMLNESPIRLRPSTVNYNGMLTFRPFSINIP